MSCHGSNFHDFVQKYAHRKTVPADEAIALMIRLVSECEHFEHVPACTWPGQPFAVLSNNHKEENKVIRQMNAEIRQTVKRMKTAAATHRNKCK
jgi:hypothetical protein